MNIRAMLNKLRFAYYDRRSNRFTRDHPRYARYQIGEYTYGFPFVYDWNEGATLKIGKFCSIARDVRIFLGGNHRSDWVTTYPFPQFFKEAEQIKDYIATKGDVIIGNDVWIGSGTMILSGVTIGDGAVIGAGSVVSRSVPPYAVAAGNPAKVVKMRFDAEQIKKLLQIRWWDWPTEKLISLFPLLLSSNIDEFLLASQGQEKGGI